MESDPRHKVFYRKETIGALQRPMWTNGNRIHLIYCDEAIQCDKQNGDYHRWIMYHGTWMNTYPRSPEKVIRSEENEGNKIPTTGWQFRQTPIWQYDETMEVRQGEPGFENFIP